MTDTVPAVERSRIMSRIKGKDTNPELILCKMLSAKGYKYRKNYAVGRKTIDIAFIHEKVAILVDGCFWHGCSLHAKTPKSNVKYWKAKIEANVKRDKITEIELKSKGWRVIRMWEHQIKIDNDVAINRVVDALNT